MRNFVHIDKISQNSSQNVAACIALRNSIWNFTKWIVSQNIILFTKLKSSSAWSGLGLHIESTSAPATPMLARIKLNPEL